MMRILMTASELRAWRAEQVGAVGVVPTMGALHEGHISLVRRAAEECASVVVTIFVNPTQFGPNEDYERYPRTLTADCELLEGEVKRYTGCAFAVFAPSVEELYPAGASTVVEVAALDAKLDGGSRPGHFRGVATVVTKLLNAAQATCAYFGQKDAAQCAVIRRLAKDLLIGTEIVVCPIVRESDGLAMSSRNRYLSAEERVQALVLHRALQRIEMQYCTGQRSVAELCKTAREVFADTPKVRLDYLVVVDGETLEPLQTVLPGALCAVAAYVGTTRLIDNLIFP